MQTLENDSAVTPFPVNDAATATTTSSYEVVRFIAVQHGILNVSKPHEIRNRCNRLKLGGMWISMNFGILMV